MTESLPFNAFSSDLRRGITLVEASAGTGKTFSIAMLVLRAVVELGIPIEKILVVTFTIAATEELKERVRTRLIEARTVLKHSTSDAGEDAELCRWAKSLPDRDLAVQRLESALIDVDQAAIQTIHGFCQKTLHEHALESGHLFDMELVPDISATVAQVVQDYWRERMYPIDPAMGKLVLEAFDSPAALYSTIKGAENENTRLVPPPFSVEETIVRLERTWGDFSDWFRGQGSGLHLQLSEVAGSGRFKSTFSDRLQGLFDILEVRINDQVMSSVSEIGWLDRSALLASLDGRRVRSPEDRAAIIDTLELPNHLLSDYLEAVAGLLLGLRLELARMLRDQLPDRLEKRNVLSFDDLVTGLSRAVRGVGGQELCHQAGSRYQVALIDEFQDTDQAQWHVFSSLFGTENHYLYLIGDPKQAIYRFRGADIQSYFAARTRADVHFTLENNYRSCHGLMESVNDLLDGAEIAGDPYRPIRAARQDVETRLISDDGNVENIIYCQLEESENGDGSWSATEAGRHVRNWITAEISSLLGDPGGSVIESAGQAGHIVAARVKPADIAILVRSNRQAEEYRDDLRHLGIPAVMASKIPVFSTVECADLLMVLQAIQSPANTRLLKAALTRDWFGLSGDDHARTCGDERLLGNWQDTFQRYYELWQQAGFLPMFRDFLERERVYLRLGQFQGAERRITNIDHLAELVQESELSNGYRISQTVQWLQKAAEGASLTDEVELRLESDSEGVTIRTMHGAKGLEFPIVFCPSLLTTSYLRENGQIVFSHDEQGQRICDLGSVSFGNNRISALDEERQEDMRLAYVAITRATLRVYLFWAEIKKWGKRPSSFDSPLGILLFPQGRSTFAEQRRGLLDKAGRNDCGYRLVQHSRSAAPYRTALNEHVLLRPRVRSERVLLTSRTRTSFSGLARLTSHEETLAGAFDEAPPKASIEAVQDDTGDSRQKAVLPGGVRFGNIVHDILERLTFREIVEGSYDKELLDSLGRHYNLVFDSTDLARLLHNTVQTKLLEDTDGNTFRLADLDEQHLVKEMEFTLALERLPTKTINDLLSTDLAFTPLSAKTIEGYITGYIDLICKINGCYYVIDYKTNYLGNDAGQYNHERLMQAMRSHNYGLQYWLYTLVVHRHLRGWLPSYRYADHFGGVMYLFVRGMAEDVPGSGVYFTRPDESVLHRLDEKLGGGVDV